MICPSCGLRDADDEKTGFCTPCAEDRVVERYLEREAEQVDGRRQEWATRTHSSGRHPVRERQRRHRLKEKLRPREVMDWADPLELGKEALQRLDRVKQSLGSKWSVQMAALSDLDEACELVRQLAWGPTGVDIADVEVVEVAGPSPRRRIVIVRPRRITPVEGQDSLWEEAG